ncbi:MAG: GFA family protein [Alphaproteobacteria bacterium]
MAKSYEGGCLCGAVRFRVGGEPRFVAHCHCQSCRRQVGGVIATFAGYAAKDVEWIKGRPNAYASSPGVARSFCKSCGTPLAYESEKRPGDIDLFLGAFDAPEKFPATLHVWTSERVAWFHADESLPRYPRTPRDSKREN